MRIFNQFLMQYLQA